MRRSGCLLLAVSLGCASAVPTPEPVSRSGVIDLVFGWSPGTGIVVRTTETRTRTGTHHRTPRVRSWSTRMEIDVETAGEGLGIRYSRPTFESEGRRLPPSAERTIEQAASLVPDFRVSRDGSFAGLRDIAQFRADVLEYMERSVSQDLPPEAQARIREGLSSELTIRDKTRSRWDAIVGSWSGAQVKLGVPLVTLAPQSIPLFPGRSILMRLVRTARRLVPCARGGQARTCIELEVLAASDPADAARLIEAIRKDFSAKEQREDAMFESIEMYSALRVTTEPDGLYPHKVWSRRVTRARFSRQGHEWHADQTTELRESYAYR